MNNPTYNTNPYIHPCVQQYQPSPNGPYYGPRMPTPVYVQPAGVCTIFTRDGERYVTMFENDIENLNIKPSPENGIRCEGYYSYPMFTDKSSTLCNCDCEHCLFRGNNELKASIQTLLNALSYEKLNNKDIDGFNNFVNRILQTIADVTDSAPATFGEMFEKTSSKDN